MMGKRLLYILVVAVFLAVGCKEENIPVAEVSLDKSEMKLLKGDSFNLAATVLPVNATYREVTWSSSDAYVATVDEKGHVFACSAGVTDIMAMTAEGRRASCKVMVTDSPVDMGLSVKWARCNLGAMTPGGHGDFYSWGEIELKPKCGWTTYKWTFDSGKTMEKYNTDSSYGKVDGKTVLESSDDVANADWGLTWRMPTDKEWAELLDIRNCSWVWKKYDGIPGYNVTSLTTGNTIFLPVTGFRDGGTTEEAGTWGYYWSSSLYENNPRCAWYMSFSSEKTQRNCEDRCFGFFIRPVSE